MAPLFADRPDVREAEARLIAAAGRIHLRPETRARVFDRVLGSAGDRRRWRAGWPARVAAVAATCAALAAVGWWRLPAVRARALVAEAHTATPAATGLTSLHMVSTDLQRTRGGRACSVVVRVWWRAPDAWRVDRSGGCGPATVSVGRGGSVTRYPAAGGRPVTSAGTGGGVLPTAGVRALLRSSWPQAKARISGEASIAGHPVTEVTVTPTYRHAFGAMWPGVYEGRSVLWIDPHTHLVLRAATYTAGGRLWSALTPTTVVYNPPLAPGQLRFDPPPAAVRGASAPAQPAAVAWGPLSLAAARARATFPVLAPASVPPGLRLVLQGARSGPIPLVTLTGYDAAGHPVLDIREQPASGVERSALPAAMRTGPTVRVDGQAAHRFAGAHLWWVVHGVWVSVGSDRQVPGALSFAQVRQVAAALSPTAHPALTGTVPAPRARPWRVWIPTRAPGGLPVGRGRLGAGRSGVGFTQAWSWANPAYAEDVVVREVPAPGLADGPVPPGAQLAGIGPWPSTSRQTVRVGPVSATLSVFQPAGAPPALALHVLSFVRAGTAVQITAQGVAHGGATITRLAAGMVPRQADGASWSLG